MREIIQRERKIELACEGVYYWDSRRWKTAQKRAEPSDTGLECQCQRGRGLLYFDYGLYAVIYL